MTDTRYTFDSEKLEKLRKESPWKSEAKYFKDVCVSPTAIVKMMTHCQSGVDKGIRKGGNPIEVMGLLLGRPDPQTPKTLVVTDVFPLPIEGFETRVIADDEDVVNHMIALGESLENTRKEKFMGWHHSHPFDLGPNSHCFLSSTDITTQLQWQRMEDPHGNPFLAMVVDPLRSMAKETPQVKAFRVYPPEYSSSVANECPDGSIIADEKERLEKWGSCCNRYYELDIDYFMSNSARRVMDILTKNLWMNTLSLNSLESENRKQYPDRIEKVAETIKKADATGFAASFMEKRSMPGLSSSSGLVRGVSSSGGIGSSEGSSSSTRASSKKAEEIGEACDELVDFASEKIHEGFTQIAKQSIFS